MMREIVSSLYTFMLEIDDRIKALDRKITAVFKASEACQRIAKDPWHWTEDLNGDDRRDRQWRRLQERASSGSLAGTGPAPAFQRRAPCDGGISKRGSQHLRTLLVHGARAVVRTAVRKNWREQHVGKRIAPAAWLQPRNGGGRQISTHR
ncbi:MAG TPA: hypothetical protein VMF50_17865 [Candidatus Binataceae bacterium]|nr:hypothetical protein [Candidatus Binataceae bacterium]